MNALGYSTLSLLAPPVSLPCLSGSGGLATLAQLGHVALHDPWWLFALLTLPLVAWLRNRRSVSVWIVPYMAAWHRTSIAPLSRWPGFLVILGVALIILALARPQRIEDKREVRTEGYDLVLAVDLSGSMLAEDFEKNGQRLNRLQTIKPVIQAFIQERPNDRIGIVIFSGRAYTLAPLTFDHGWLSRQLERLRIGLIEDGTAIGDGLGVALSRLEQAKRESAGKRQGAFIVLLTDGANNRGTLAPHQAADLARARSIPIYTIGAGRDGYVRMPILDQQGRTVTYQTVVSDLDEGTLVAIAEKTGGRFFRARDTDAIENAFASIDRAKKIEFQAKSYLLTTELFPWFAVPGVLCLLAALGVLLTRSKNPLPVAS